MPTPTVDLIAEITNPNATSFDFTSIPGTYKDLILEFVDLTTSASGKTVCVRANGDTAANYSYTHYSAAGTAKASAMVSGSANGFLLGGAVATTSATEGLAGMLHIMSYASTAIYKSTVSRCGRPGVGLEQSLSQWRSTTAITSLTVRVTATPGDISGTFRLWGVAG